MNNEKLIKENKELLQIFPHGVIIKSADFTQKQQTRFANDEFKSQIKNIQEKIDALKDIKVEFKEPEGITECTDLHTYLKEQQQELRQSKITEHNGVTIW